MNHLQKYLSYLWDIRIEERSSDYNAELFVFLSSGRYQLCTRDAIYSHEDKYFNFREILGKHINYESLKGKKALILGLGLASIPILLDNLHPGQWNITGVEIDEEIIDLATKYALPNIQSNIHTIVADGLSFINITEETYDLICVDIFIGQRTPQKFKTFDFLNTVKQLLNPRGILIYNTIAFTKNDLETSVAFFENTFKQVFQSGQAIHAHRNLMLLNR